MSYSTDHLRTAGKITVYTTFLGLAVFAVVFIFNLGTAEIKQAGAQSDIATTSVTVLNTPPFFTVEAIEDPGSTTSAPTNVGDQVTWVGTADDANSEPFYLLICSDNATPTANSGAAPSCDPGATQWGVSASTTAGTEAAVSTTTTAVAPFAGESFDWYAWVCDDNAATPRCSATSTQGRFGATATSSSPFEVNHRPTFTAYSDTSPADPGVAVTFYSTSTDADSSGTQDTVRLFVCSTNSFNTVTDECDDTTLASTSPPGVVTDASAVYTIVIPTQDQDYNAFGFVIDNHGFEATGGSQGTDTTLTVNNVAPTVSSSTIFVNGGGPMVLSNAATQTPGFTLQFITSDNNSCDAVGGTNYDEVVDYNLSIYRAPTGNSSTTCTVNGNDYDPNNCYPDDESTSVWNLQCTASTTSCTFGSDNIDTTTVWDCTFPLWYIADPTDGTATSTQYPTDSWFAQVQGIDDDSAVGPLSESESGVNVNSFLAFVLNTLTIPYGTLEPGQRNDPLVATTTISATGNIGLDKDVQGESMCTTYTGATPCPNSATSTIPENRQVFATGTVSYGTASSSGWVLSSTTAQEIEVNVPKSTATSTQANSDAYWGIEVPSAITFSGDYTGENTITALVGESADW